MASNAVLLQERNLWPNFVGSDRQRGAKKYDEGAQGAPPAGLASNLS